MKTENSFVLLEGWISVSQILKFMIQKHKIFTIRR